MFDPTTHKLGSGWEGFEDTLIWASATTNATGNATTSPSPSSPLGCSSASPIPASPASSVPLVGQSPVPLADTSANPSPVPTPPRTTLHTNAHLAADIGPKNASPSVGQIALIIAQALALSLLAGQFA